MDLTDFTGFLLPLAGLFLAVFALGGYTTSGYIAGVTGTISVLIDVGVIYVVAKNIGGSEVNVPGAAVEALIHFGAAVILLLAGWPVPAALYTAVVVLDAVIMTIWG